MSAECKRCGVMPVDPYSVPYCKWCAQARGDNEMIRYGAMWGLIVGGTVGFLLALVWAHYRYTGAWLP